jgi:hypothetical protein
LCKLSVEDELSEAAHIVPFLSMEVLCELSKVIEMLASHETRWAMRGKRIILDGKDSVRSRS